MRFVPLPDGTRYEKFSPITLYSTHAHTKIFQIALAGVFIKITQPEKELVLVGIFRTHGELKTLELVLPAKRRSPSSPGASYCDNSPGSRSRYRHRRWHYPMEGWGGTGTSSLCMSIPNITLLSSLNDSRIARSQTKIGRDVILVHGGVGIPDLPTQIRQCVTEIPAPVLIRNPMIVQAHIRRKGFSGLIRRTARGITRSQIGIDIPRR